MATPTIVLWATQNFLLLFAIVFIAAFVWHYLRRPRNLPPGPRGLPLVGSALSLGARPDVTLKDWSTTYGPVMSLYLGPQLFVILSDFDSVRDAFLKEGESFSGRPTYPYFELLSAAVVGKDIRNLYHGLIQSDGKPWKEQRKFAMSKLREFGMGKVSLEGKIKEEISALLAELKSHDGKEFDSKTLLTTSVCNVICSIMFGSRFEYDDAEFKTLVHVMDAEFENYAVQGALNFFPWLRHFPPFRRQFHEMITNERIIFGLLQQKIEQHVGAFDSNNLRDFTDTYLAEIKQEAKRGASRCFFTDEELLFILTDLFMAGTETTSTTLRWGLLFMLKYPMVCKKVQSEIDDVIGRGRLPTMADKNKMPFTEATIMEIQRLGDIVPLGIPHSTPEEVVFRGYTIPAHAHVISNLTAVMTDPTYFPHPGRFTPERFLDENGSVIKNDALIPFSIGRRVCLGEALARMELFLFFVSILQNFDVNLPEGMSEPCMEGIFGITYMPKINTIRLVQRE
ncbi:PREDICTED: cytochrome P450 2C20-like [Priapulus caudatus]|uniref:Cytochrome P450 2C20-like n=1 Tax=Priapulus caudatus TaxID=37621 RepID=A0ABM1DXP4_PRICU|nr:PREDICTED: cytochrome P450 2C20-like [Priapulus caudatus]